MRRPSCAFALLAGMTAAITPGSVHADAPVTVDFPFFAGGEGVAFFEGAARRFEATRHFRVIERAVVTHHLGMRRGRQAGHIDDVLESKRHAMQWAQSVGVCPRQRPLGGTRPLKRPLGGEMQHAVQLRVMRLDTRQQRFYVFDRRQLALADRLRSSKMACLRLVPSKSKAWQSRRRT